jgi:NAD(P)-dependent dehydrogenase (short-subunit alcohol dehydrogenase family)
MGIMDPSRLFRLDGKTALVTGCAKGLGKEIALGLARSGASMILADIVQTEDTVKRIEASGARCITFQTDVSDEAAVKELAESSASQFKQVDILVNNAGISQLSFTPTEDLPTEEWDRVMDVNLKGSFLCCKHVGKRMIETGGGNIVNIATTAGITGVNRAPAYSASKAGVILLTKSLALEWARHNIRVNAIAPHYLETDLTKGIRTSDKVYKALVKQIPMRRFGKTSELIGAVLFLCSEASTYVTGTVIPVDGGYLAQ